jgi:hypothetical protein
MARAGRAVTGYVAQLTGHSAAELPDPDASGGDWLDVLRQWLARLGYGLVAIENANRFSWPGHWIGILDGADPAAVLLFGTPSAVISSPDDPSLLGRSVGELEIHQGLVLAPFQPFTRHDASPRSLEGKIVGIYVSEAKTGPMRSVATATALKGRGLAGDRYAAGAGTFTPRSDRLRGYDLTLIESEVLDDVKLAAADSRRNLVTAGVDLNGLVGKEFRIGSVRAFGQRLCEPCVHLQRLTRPGVVGDLVHRGGLRADILAGGEIHVGDRIVA